MPDKKTLAKIHIAKKDLDLSEENYRAMLSGFGVESSKNLSDKKAIEFLEACKKLGWKPKSSQLSKSKIKNEFRIILPESRPDEYATQKQMDMLTKMWVRQSREKTKESFIKFVCNIAKVNLPDWLLKKDVQKVKLAIENL